MKYKVGDRVRIKSLDWYNENKDEEGDVRTAFFNEARSKYCGQVVTIDGEGVQLQFSGMIVYSIQEGSEWIGEESIEGIVEDETKFGTVSNPIEIKSNANCLTRERVNELAAKIDKELPSGDQNVWELPDGYQFVDENGNVINATKIVLEKKKPKYPKTYEECCAALGIPTYKYNRTGHRCKEITTFHYLLICRDAYWKLAGEEMELGEPWKPKFGGEPYYYIGVFHYEVESKRGLNGLTNCTSNTVLAFPDDEMRDAFYENFKEIIEECKELL